MTRGLWVVCAAVLGVVFFVLGFLYLRLAVRRANEKVVEVVTLLVEKPTTGQNANTDPKQ